MVYNPKAAGQRCLEDLGQGLSTLWASLPGSSIAPSPALVCWAEHGWDCELSDQQEMNY